MPMPNRLQLGSGQLTCHGSNQSSKLQEHANDITLAGVYEVYIADLLVGSSTSGPQQDVASRLDRWMNSTCPYKELPLAELASFLNLHLSSNSSLRPRAFSMRALKLANLALALPSTL